MSDGYRVEPELLEQRITTLNKLGELTGDLVATASRLAERLPMLGTAPPAVHLAMRLRDAAGRSGLAGEVQGAQQEVEGFQRTLSDTRDSYAERESDTESAVRQAGDAQGQDGGGHEQQNGSTPGHRDGGAHGQQDSGGLGQQTGGVQGQQDSGGAGQQVGGVQGQQAGGAQGQRDGAVQSSGVQEQQGGGRS
jgi:hypothetical protein